MSQIQQADFDRTKEIENRVKKERIRENRKRNQTDKRRVELSMTDLDAFERWMVWSFVGRRRKS